MPGILCALFLLVILGLAPAAAAVPIQVTKATIDAETKRSARKLANSWVDTASASTLDQLANRSIAFAGLVPGIFVVLDGKRMNAGQALIDSALTIITQSNNSADAAAIRNSVYILNEIANGRTTRGNARPRRG